MSPQGKTPAASQGFPLSLLFACHTSLSDPHCLSHESGQSTLLLKGEDQVPDIGLPPLKPDDMHGFSPFPHAALPLSCASFLVLFLGFLCTLPSCFFLYLPNGSCKRATVFFASFINIFAVSETTFELLSNRILF